MIELATAIGIALLFALVLFGIGALAGPQPDPSYSPGEDIGQVTPSYDSGYEIVETYETGEDIGTSYETGNW